MKASSVVIVLFLSAICSGEMVLNYSQEQDPRISHGFASGSNTEALTMLSAVKYRSIYAIDSLMKISAGFTKQDSISSLLEEKDGLCLVSNHKGPVCQYYVFDMTPVYSLLGDDSITGATFKWSGKAVRDGGGCIKMRFNACQAGHVFKYCDVDDSITLELADTTFAPGWFSPDGYYFFEKELAVYAQIEAEDDAVYGLYTDFVEIILHTSDITGVKSKQFRISPNSSAGFGNIQDGMIYDISGRKVNGMRLSNGIIVGQSGHKLRVNDNTAVRHHDK